VWRPNHIPFAGNAFKPRDDNQIDLPQSRTPLALRC
jgi:hypothetical protein